MLYTNAQDIITMHSFLDIQLAYSDIFYVKVYRCKCNACGLLSTCGIWVSRHLGTNNAAYPLEWSIIPRMF